MTTTNLKNQIIATDMDDLMLSIAFKGLTFENLSEGQRTQVDEIVVKSVEIRDRIKKLGKDLKGLAT